MCMLQKITQDLLDAGLSQEQIVKRLRAENVLVTQSTISRIKDGKIARNNFELGIALVALHRKVCKKRR